MVADVEAAQESHPLIEAGLYSGPVRLAAALSAVSRGLGQIGGELAWKRVPHGGGEIPMALWLDTAETPEARGTAFIPS